MISPKQFAPQYPRNAAGIIEIPEDRKLRQELFPVKVEHPAKNNLYMLDAIAEYLTEPGDVICDPMAGAGSTMYVARTGRRVVLIELSPYFLDLLVQNQPSFPGSISILPGDCRKILQILSAGGTQFDLIMFSPPYANSVKQASAEQGNRWSIHEGATAFSENDPDNLGTMSEFWFNKAMQDVYAKCFAALKPGKHMVIIIKDSMKQGIRVRYAELQSRTAIRLGFELREWHRHTHIGKLWGNFNKARGVEQVEEEEILMFRRPI